MTADRPVMLITGARKGIGRYLVYTFMSKGYWVIGCSRHAPDWSLEGYEHILADVRDERQVEALFCKIGKSYGRLDAVMNCAGVASMNHFLLMPGSAIGRILDTNLMGTCLVCRESARLMARREFGRIVNFSTVAVPLALAGEAVYAASKSAVETLTRVLAREFSPMGITVNAIGPAPTDTNLIRGVPEEKIESVRARLAIKRPGTLDDIANLAEFLVKPESGYITGQTIYLGGP